jgi:integrase
LTIYKGEIECIYLKKPWLVEMSAGSNPVFTFTRDDWRPWREVNDAELRALLTTEGQTIGTLRAILKRSGQWARVQPDVRMLPTREDVGRAITPEEEAALLQACVKSRSRSLVPFVTLAIETGARFGVIRTLQWGSVDFENRCLRWGKLGVAFTTAQRAIERLERVGVLKRVTDAKRHRVYCAQALLDILEEPANLIDSLVE